MWGGHASLSGQVLLSLSNRLPELRALLKQRPEVAQRLLDCFGEARDHVRLAERMRVSQHPDLLATWAQVSGRRRPKREQFSPALKDVVYRASVLSSGHVLRSEARYHSAAGDKDEANA